MNKHMAYSIYDKEYYIAHKHDDEYEGKHEAKDYLVELVLGPAGPVERKVVHGMRNVRDAITGCWDWTVTTVDGKEVNV